MGVTNTVVGQRYTPNGVTTTFAIPFAFISGDTTTIKVYEINTTTGVRTLKALTTDYTLSPSGDDPVNVVYVTAPAASVGKVSIERVLPLTQLTDYITSGRFQAESHELQMDKIVLILQELEDRLDRMPLGHILDKDAGASFDLTQLSVSPSHYLTVNDDGDGFEFREALSADMSPMTTPGDTVYRGATGAARLALGTQGKYIRAGATYPDWTFPGVGVAINNTNSPYTLPLDYDVVLVSNVSADVTINLPAASTVPGRIVYFKKVDSAVYNVILDGNASETIDGTTTFSFQKQYGSIAIMSDGSNWHSISKSRTSTQDPVDVKSKTTTYTATTNDTVILCSTSSAGWTLTLPAASGNTGLMYHIKKTSSDANVLTIDGNASETIDGTTTKTITTQYDAITIVCDGSNWHIV